MLQAIKSRIQTWLDTKEKFVVYECEDDDPYLTRYTLFTSPLGKLKLHIFHRSDKDEELHDHPWSFFTLILWGGYWEHQPVGRFFRFPGQLLYRPAEWKHRVVLRQGQKKAVTLVWTFKGKREWGFWKDRKTWVHWQDWVNDPKRCE